MSRLAYLLAHASGLSLADCCFLGYRYDKSVGFRWDKLDSWVLQRNGSGVRPLISRATWLTDLWRSRSGQVYVSGPGKVTRLIPQEAEPGWSSQDDKLDAALAGIWGLDDRQVFTWGERGSKNVMFLWNGTSWREIPSPGYVNGVHGISPELIYAVGQQGLLARWDGNKWERVPSFTDTMLSRVHIVSRDEMYAVGAGQRLLEGSVYGWSEVLVAEGQLHDVARHGDKVWVAAGDDGLFTLEGNKLELFSAKVKPDRIDARGELLISARTLIVQLLPDRKFQTSGLDGFIQLTENEPTPWLDRIQ